MRAKGIALRGAGRPRCEKKKSGEGTCTHLDSKLGDVLDELGAMLLLHIVSPLLECLARRRVSARAQEPGLNDGGELGRRHIAVEHLLAMIPPHTALRDAAADKHHIALGARCTTAEALHGLGHAVEEHVGRPLQLLQRGVGLCDARERQP